MKEEQWSQAAQVMGKCLLCLLVVPPLLQGAGVCPTTCKRTPCLFGTSKGSAVPS